MVHFIFRTNRCACILGEVLTNADFKVNMLRLICLVALFMPTVLLAAIEASTETTIKRLISYNQYGGGDVVFTVHNPSSTCHGYWIEKNDAGFEANLSMLLASYHAKAKVKVHGFNHIKWSGSNNYWCKLYAIEHLN